MGKYANHKSQLRGKLGCWEVIRGFSSTLCQWQVISVWKKIEKGLHRAFFLHLPLLHP